MSDEISEVILERVFETVDADGNTGTITLQLGKPYFEPDATTSLNWCCPYRIISNLISDKIRFAPGIDGIDALLTALNFAELRIKSPKQKITWLGEEHLGLAPLDLATLKERGESSIDPEDNFFQQIFDEFFRNFDPKRPPR